MQNELAILAKAILELSAKAAQYNDAYCTEDEHCSTGVPLDFSLEEALRKMANFGSK